MQWNEKKWGLLCMGVGLSLLGWGWAHPETPRAGDMPVLLHVSPNITPVASSHEIATRQACKVLTVYDGDTIGCDLNGNGKLERPGEVIRLLGIDSPEMHYSRKNLTYATAHPQDEPMAPEASRWMTNQVRGKVVYLQYDQRRWDKYRRTLAFVYDGPQTEPSLNQQMLSLGYATVLFIGKNRLHEPEFNRAEIAARKARRGVWGL